MSDGTLGFPTISPVYIKNSQLRGNLKGATSTIRRKRAEVVAEKSDWEDLRVKAQLIKDDVLENLGDYLVELEAAVRYRGGQVHWARDAVEANVIIGSLIRETGEDQVIKVKSLTTDEIQLNAYLSDLGITAIETDLAELIVQLAGDKPSHILVPAIHKNRSEIKTLFENTIATGQKLSDDPRQLAEVARLYLREKFLNCNVAISGANFAVAETGTICVVESEGNGRMCLTLPKTLITVMGIEKIIPKFGDLSVFLQLLPRSSTGERMNPYTSLWSGVYEQDGPSEFHLILLDNNRTKVLSDPVTRQTLRCIRCSACLNVCPVYERSGGHAYESVYPGPIGSILSPQLFGAEKSGTLPWASSLCGACYEVCPVRINIPQVLVHLREKVLNEASSKNPEFLAFKALSWFFTTQKRYEKAQSLLSRTRNIQNRTLKDHHIPGPLGKWLVSRNLPQVPEKSFRTWWKERTTQD